MARQEAARVRAENIRLERERSIKEEENRNEKNRDYFGSKLLNYLSASGKELCCIGRYDKAEVLVTDVKKSDNGYNFKIVRKKDFLEKENYSFQWVSSKDKKLIFSEPFQILDFSNYKVKRMQNIDDLRKKEVKEKEKRTEIEKRRRLAVSMDKDRWNDDSLCYEGYLWGQKVIIVGATGQPFYKDYMFSVYFEENFYKENDSSLATAVRIDDKDLVILYDTGKKASYYRQKRDRIIGKNKAVTNGDVKKNVSNASATEKNINNNNNNEKPHTKVLTPNMPKVIKPPK